MNLDAVESRMQIEPLWLDLNIQILKLLDRSPLMMRRQHSLNNNHPTEVIDIWLQRWHY